MEALIISIGLSILAGIGHSIDEIRDNKPDKTWLPKWIWSTKNWFGLPEKWPWKILDGYHFVKGLFIISVFYSGQHSNINPWIAGIIFFVVFWETFNLFYHKVFVRE